MKIEDQVFGNKLQKYKLLKRNLVEVMVFKNYKYKLISVSICNTDTLCGSSNTRFFWFLGIYKEAELSPISISKSYMMIFK